MILDSFPLRCWKRSGNDEWYCPILSASITYSGRPWCGWYQSVGVVVNLDDFEAFSVFGAAGFLYAISSGALGSGTWLGSGVCDLSCCFLLDLWISEPLVLEPLLLFCCALMAFPNIISNNLCCSIRRMSRACWSTHQSLWFGNGK